MKRLLLAALVTSIVLLAGTATAGAATLTLKGLAKTVAALQKKVDGQAAKITLQEKTIASLTNDLASAKQTIAALDTSVQGHTTTLANAAPVLAIAPYISLSSLALDGVAGPNIVISGANLHVRSGAGSSYTANGLGNLIVGYNEPPESPAVGYRGGSGNLVVGKENSFPSSGCLVAGVRNTVGSQFNSVSGGLGNTANGSCASVSGGWYNSATGLFASVSGGAVNIASGDSSSVSGGYNNRATAQQASVSGGSTITLGTGYGWAAGKLVSNP
jgi:hypothetical protein